MKPPLTRTAIAEGLRALGLRSGDAVGVHSSLSSLGQVEGAWRAVGLVALGLAILLGCATGRREALPDAGAGAARISLHVSPRGDDALGLGTAAAPFATLERARDELRASRRAARTAAAEVVVDAGDYVLTNAFVLEAVDGGADGAPVIYRAAVPGKARLLGGRTVSGFAPVTEAAIMERLSPEAREQVRVVDLTAAGIADLGALSARGFARPTIPAQAELFYAGRPMTLARWPNAGSATRITGFVEGRSNEWGEAIGEWPEGFFVQLPKTRHWQSTDDLWMHGYWCWDWANSYERVQRLDVETGRVWAAPPYGQYGIKPGQRLYFLNVLEELDQPGEYYIDRATGLLYFWPSDDALTGEALVSELETPLIRVDGAAHVELCGLVIEGGRASGVEIHDGDDVVVRRCTVRNVGNFGVKITGGTRHAVLGCEVSDTGDAAVDVAGGDRRTLAPAGHRVEDCHLHHFGRWTRTYQPGVCAGGCGITIAHNLIHDAPHTAILFWGNDIQIDGNEIYRVCLETGDAGAIYTGRDYSFRGNAIRDNFIHHVGCLGGKSLGTCAIYMDDCVSGHEISGNVVWGGDAIWLGGGRDHVIHDNVFVACRVGVQADARGLSTLVGWSNMVHETMRQRLEDVGWREPPYTSRFPELEPLVAYEARRAGIPPEHNVVLRTLGPGVEHSHWNTNLVVDPDWFQESGGVVDESPGFVDTAWGDFRLRADARVVTRGIRPPALETVGPRAGAAADWPRVRSRLDLLSQEPTQAVLRLGLRNEGRGEARGIMVIEGVRVPYVLKAGRTQRTTVAVPVHVGSQAFEAFDEAGPARPARCTVVSTGAALRVHPASVHVAAGKMAAASDWRDALDGDALAGTGLVVDPSCTYRAIARWTPEALVIAVDRGDATPLTSRVDPEIDPDNGWSSDCLQVRVWTDRVVSFTIWPYAARQETVVQIQDGDATNAFAGSRHQFVGRAGGVLGPGIMVQYALKPDGTGYQETVSIPWNVIYDKVPAVEPGLALRLGVQLIWGDESGAAMLAGVDLNRDPAAPGVSFPRTPAAWREVTLLAK